VALKNSQTTILRAGSPVPQRHDKKLICLMGCFVPARIATGHGRAPSQKRLIAVGAIQDHLDKGQTLGIKALTDPSFIASAFIFRLVLMLPVSRQDNSCVKNRDIRQPAFASSSNLARVSGVMLGQTEC
jgi:hypothetical protein